MKISTYLLYLLLTGIVIGGALYSDKLMATGNPDPVEPVQGQVQVPIPQISPTPTITLDSDEIFELTNIERTKNKLPTLTRDKRLDQSAKKKTQDMFENKYWEHVSPDGKQPWDFMSDAGYSFRFAGENLAKDLLHSNDVVRSWMESPDHRENILNPNFTHVGVHVDVLEINGGSFWSVVQHFASTDIGTATPSPTPSDEETL